MICGMVVDGEGEEVEELFILFLLCFILNYKVGFGEMWVKKVRNENYFNINELFLFKIW